MASKETVNNKKSLMRSVIEDPMGTGHTYYMEGYDLIAKTGTAQVADANGYGSNVIRSFAGLYPGNDPSIIIYYSAKDQGSYGVNAMKQVIQDIVANVSKYLELDKQEEDSIEALKKFTLPSFVSKRTIDVTNTLDNEGLTYVVIGNGDKIIKQYPENNTVVSELDKIYLVTNDTNITMPNLVGYSETEAKTLLNLLGINYNLEGNGYVTSQSINAGVILKKEDIVNLVLKPRF